jgi:hypothetical protein
VRGGDDAHGQDDQLGERNEEHRRQRGAHAEHRRHVVKRPAHAVARAPAAQPERLIEVVPGEEEPRNEELERHEDDERPGREQVAEREGGEQGHGREADQRRAERAAGALPERRVAGRARSPDRRVVEAHEAFERGRGQRLREQQARDERQGERGDEGERDEQPGAELPAGRRDRRPRAPPGAGRVARRGQVPFDGAGQDVRGGPEERDRNQKGAGHRDGGERPAARRAQKEPRRSPRGREAFTEAQAGRRGGNGRERRGHRRSKEEAYLGGGTNAPRRGPRPRATRSLGEAAVGARRGGGGRRRGRGGRGAGGVVAARAASVVAVFGPGARRAGGEGAGARRASPARARPSARARRRRGLSPAAQPWQCLAPSKCRSVTGSGRRHARPRARAPRGGRGAGRRPGA